MVIRSEKRKAYDKQYQKENRSKILDRKRKYYAANKEKIKEKLAAYRKTPKFKAMMREYFARHRAHLNELHRKYIAQRRQTVLLHYSHGEPECACCGETEYNFLAIDHINGGGNKHRRDLHGESQELMGWLIRNGFPDGFQVLCHNCNMAKSRCGVCPHQQKAVA